MRTRRQLASLVGVSLSGGYHYSGLLLELAHVVGLVVHGARASLAFLDNHPRVRREGGRRLVLHRLNNGVSLRSWALSTQNSFLFTKPLLVPNRCSWRPAQDSCRFRPVHSWARRLAPQISDALRATFLAECGSGYHP